MIHMTYVHDDAEELLYAFPTEPTIEPKQNRYGDTKAWKISVEVQISSPNNKCKKGRWLIPLTDTYRDEYPLNMKEKVMITTFKDNYYPRGRYLKRTDYEALKAEYDAASGVW